MTTEVKNFIKGIEGLTKEQRDFLNNNRMTFAVRNIKRNDDGSVEFESVTDFHKVEQVKLSKSEQKVWDLFNDFNSPKNASNVIMDAIHRKTGINAESYKNQGKITAPDTHDFKGVETFIEFWETLDAEARKSAIALAQRWLKDNHIDQTSFEFFFVNGENGVNLENGDYVRAYDPAYGQTMMTRVFQASEGGLVTCLDNGGYFTLAMAGNPQKISKEAVPNDIAEILDKTFDKITEDTDEHKQYRLEQAIKRAERNAKAEAKAQARAERKAKKEAEAQAKEDAREKAVTEIMALKLDSPEAIKQAVEMINDAGLDKERKAKVRETIKTARATLKAKAEAKKEAKANAKANEEAKANARSIKATKTAPKPKAKAKGKETAKA